jgi:2-polyprenyl-3-methyl-5-hydroxy-6-metoxy-1,4-benzoquinol methylase
VTAILGQHAATAMEGLEAGTDAREVCGACGAAGRQRQLIRRLGNSVGVTRCSACTVTSLRPLPSAEELRRHYASYYLTRADDTDRQNHLVELHKGVFDYLLRHVRSTPPHAFLDYGFGSGAFLRYAARRAHRAMGADLSPQNVRQLQEAARCDGVTIGLIDLSTNSLGDLCPNHFDVVTLFQVVEHLACPLRLISKLSCLQEPGGLLYLECPNDSAAWAHAKNFFHRAARSTAWNSLKYPEHLHGFNRRSIAALLQAGGYDLVDCGDYAYRDGLHQVESEFWWPKFRSHSSSPTLSGLVRSAIPLFDGIMSARFGAGSGLYALGRKRPHRN